MKMLFLVMDGAGDVGDKTPLELARKPAMERLAKSGKVGLLDIGYKKTVNSDFGYLKLFGCYSKEEYPGRGYLEALGIGINPGENDICIRANFATLDRMGNVKDRRAGRETLGLDSLSSKLDGMTIEGIKFQVKHGAGHRAVIVMRGKHLSDKVKPNDPLETGVPVLQVKPITPEGKRTASALNMFLRRANKILEDAPINRKRKFPANVLLVRNFGKPRKVKSFEERYKMRAVCVAGIPIAKGVARFLGMDIINVKGANGLPDTNLEGKIDATIKALKKYNFVFLHINGTDILSHDAHPKEKKLMIQKIDEGLSDIVSLHPDIIYIVTCDHRTASDPGYKDYRHTKDPVPALVSGPGIEACGLETFNEKSCKEGFKVAGDEFLTYVIDEIED